MAFAVSTWVENTIEKIVLSDGEATHIILYDMYGDSYTRALSRVSGREYFFTRPEAAELDKFDVMDGSHFVFRHDGEYSIEKERDVHTKSNMERINNIPPRPGIIPPGQEHLFDYSDVPQIPQSDFSSRQIEIGYYKRNPGAFRSGTNNYSYAYSNAIPENFTRTGVKSNVDGYNLRRYLAITPRDDALFASPYAPIEMSRQELSELLQSVEELFEYEFMGHYHIDEDRQLFVPISNGVEVYVEEIDMEVLSYRFLTGAGSNLQNRTGRGDRWVITSLNSPQKVGYRSYQTLEENDEYNTDEIPSEFRREIDNTVYTIDIYRVVVGMGEFISDDPFVNPENYRLIIPKSSGYGPYFRSIDLTVDKETL